MQKTQMPGEGGRRNEEEIEIEKLSVKKGEGKSSAHAGTEWAAPTGARQVLEWLHSCQRLLACKAHARLGNSVQGPQNNVEEFARETCSGLFGGRRPMRPWLSPW